MLSADQRHTRGYPTLWSRGGSEIAGINWEALTAWPPPAHETLSPIKITYCWRCQPAVHLAGDTLVIVHRLKPTREELFEAAVKLVGFVVEDEERLKAAMGATPDGMYTPEDERAPVLSEAATYALLGKGDARTLRGRLREFMRLTGVDMRKAEGEAARRAAARPGTRS